MIRCPKAVPPPRIDAVLPLRYMSYGDVVGECSSARASGMAKAQWGSSPQS